MALKNILFGVFCFFFITCGHQHKHDPVLEEAGKIYMEAVKMDEEIKPALEKIAGVKQQLQQIQADLNPKEHQLLQQITGLEESYAFWDKNHIEVPGFDHTGHHHNCSHDHSAGLEVSSEDMLLIQREFKDSLSSIVERLKQLSISDSLIIQ